MLLCVCVRACARVCVCNHPIVARQLLCKTSLIVAGQRLGKIPLSLLGNGLVEKSPRIIKESRLLVLPRTSCFNSWCGVRLSPLGMSATNGPIIPPEFGGMRIGRENRNTRRKPAPLPHCPPQNSHDLAWDRTQAAAMGSRLTAVITSLTL
jgi:hypothetical protein